MSAGTLHALWRNLYQPSGGQTVWKCPHIPARWRTQGRCSKLTGTQSSAPMAPLRATDRAVQMTSLRTEASAGSPSASYPWTGRRWGIGGACSWLLGGRALADGCCCWRSLSHSRGSFSSRAIAEFGGGWVQLLGHRQISPASGHGCALEGMEPRGLLGLRDRMEEGGGRTGTLPCSIYLAACPRDRGSTAPAASQRLLPGYTSGPRRRSKEPASASPSPSRNCLLASDKSQVSPTWKSGLTDR